MTTQGPRHALPNRARAVRRRRTALVAVTALVSVSLVAVAPAPDPAVAGEPEQAPVAPAVTGTDGQDDPAPQQPADDAAPQQPTAPTPEQPAQDPAPEQPAQDPAPQPPAQDPGPQQPAPSAAATPAPDAAAPVAVPTPSEESTVIDVRVGGDRTGSTTVGPLAGVTLNLWDGTDAGPTTQRTETWATCTSDAQGDCTFTVPDTQFRGANWNRRFWVVQAGTPAGWYSNPSLVTGTADSHDRTQYRFMTPELHAGHTYVSGDHFMGSAWSVFSHDRDSSGLWQSSRVNPDLPRTCSAGLDVALVLDLSGSVGNAGALDDLKASAIAFAESLEGTGSRLALYTFATHAPRSADATGANYPLIDVDRNLQTIRSRIDAYETGGGTNWDRGIYQVATSADTYDVAIVVTDGLSTFSGPDATGPGSATRFVETEQAIASANALKAKGTRVLAVGVGEGVSGAADNLRAISGPTPYTTSARSADYFQTGWQELAGVLSSVARGATCRAGITVDKVVEPYAGTAGPGAGWTFDASTQGATIAPVRGEVTGSAGTVEYIVSFDRPDAVPSTVRLEELISQDQRADGWSLTGLACTANGAPLTTDRTGDGTSVPVAVGDDVACTFTNTQRLVPGIEIVKQAWATPTADGLDGATELPAGTTVPDGTRLTWTYTVRNTGRTVLEGIRVNDDQGVTVTCPRPRLGVGEHMVCTGSGPVPAAP